MSCHRLIARCAIGWCPGRRLFDRRDARLQHVQGTFARACLSGGSGFVFSLCRVTFPGRWSTAETALSPAKLQFRSFVRSGFPFTFSGLHHCICLFAAAARSGTMYLHKQHTRKTFFLISGFAFAGRQVGSDDNFGYHGLGDPRSTTRDVVASATERLVNPLARAWFFHLDTPCTFSRSSLTETHVRNSFLGGKVRSHYCQCYKISCFRMRPLAAVCCWHQEWRCRRLISLITLSYLTRLICTSGGRSPQDFAGAAATYPELGDEGSVQVRANELLELMGAVSSA